MFTRSCIIAFFYFSGSFDVLLYTNKDVDVPDEWAESTAHLIPECEEVKLSNFSTTVHKVDTAVQYRQND